MVTNLGTFLFEYVSNFNMKVTLENLLLGSNDELIKQFNGRDLDFYHSLYMSLVKDHG